MTRHLARLMLMVIFLGVSMPVSGKTRSKLPMSFKQIRIHITADEPHKAQRGLDQARSRQVPTEADKVVMLSVLLVEKCLQLHELKCAFHEIRWLKDGLARKDVAHRIHVYRLEVAAAFAAAVDDKKHLKHARDTLKKILSLKPSWTPAKGAWTTPQMRLLAHVRAEVERLQDKTPPRVMMVTTPSKLKHGEAATFALQANDVSGVAWARLFVGGRVFPMATLDRSTWRVTVPGKWIQGTILNVWLRVADTRGNVASWGDAKVPRVLNVLPRTMVKERSAIHKKWWFWTALGTGIAASVVLTYFLTQSDTTDANYSQLKVGVKWAQ